MKRIVLYVICMILSVSAIAQEAPKLYDESLDGVQQIKAATEQAAKENKYVVCQVGGNWCPWCIRFAKFITDDAVIHELIDANFVYIHVNYSKANKNLQAMAMLGNPGRFGFPVLVILNGNGQVIHIQNSAYLEEGQGYSRAKVLEFFQQWTPAAVTTLK
ncbi:MAG: thioredoxin family protein [Bacteroidales bacterium]|nr:thioredoxin family protein [Bacteroidales bacterium]